ncbi:hypothetical protein PC116_g31246 [Phytophthora cactorum]|nr:hypothetical protein PC116_g31246 [Phytophthora cactorum]
MFLAVFLPGFISPLVGWLADNIQHKVLLCVLLALLGITLAFANVPLMAEITYVIEAKVAEQPGVFGEKGVYGLGYGLFNMAFSLGGVVGPLWAGYVVESAGWGTLTWSFAIWAASGAVVSYLWLGGKGTKIEGADASQQEEITS